MKLFILRIKKALHYEFVRDCFVVNPRFCLGYVRVFHLPAFFKLWWQYALLSYYQRGNDMIKHTLKLCSKAFFGILCLSYNSWNTFYCINKLVHSLNMRDNSWVENLTTDYNRPKLFSVVLSISNLKNRLNLLYTRGWKI